MNAAERTAQSKNRALFKLCKEWQARLGLTDWEIDVAFRTIEEMEGNQGTCEPAPMLRTAVILIGRAEDYPGADIEATLVHELLHCYHHMGKRGSVAEMFEEQGVEATSKALVKLKREADKLRSH